MTQRPDSEDATSAAGWARLADAQTEFSTDVTYLNTASLGLPPRRSMQALQAALHRWQAGTAGPTDFDEALTSARLNYARLVGTEASRVAVGSQVSAFAGVVAAALPDGSEILTVAGEFTSIVFPFLVQAGRGITVRQVPLDDLAGAVTNSTALVAVSAVQSADGRLADLDGVTAACTAAGVRILLDTTQAVGWLPVDASRYAYTVCGGYKWLLAPRGTCFFTVQPNLADELVPHSAGWYAGQDPWASIYAGHLTLAVDARRFDVSPAWHSWVGQAPSLDLLVEIGPTVLQQHALAVANRFRSAIGAEPSDSAIVSVSADPIATEQLERAGVVGSVRAGRLRLSFHVHNTAADADRAADALAGHVHV